MTNVPKRLIFAEEYIKAAKELRKTYRNLDRDLEPLLEELRQGKTPGERLQNVQSHIIYKVRVANSDAQRGKSGGYRVIFSLHFEDSVILATLYSKSNMDDISNEFLMGTLKRLTGGR